MNDMGKSPTSRLYRMCFDRKLVVNTKKVLDSLGSEPKRTRASGRAKGQGRTYEDPTACPPDLGISPVSAQHRTQETQAMTTGPRCKTYAAW